MAREVKITITGLESTKDTLIDEVNEVTRRFVVDAYKNLRDATPVDTGTARASWQVVKKGGAPNDVPYGPHRTPTIPVIPHGDVNIMSSSPYMIFLNAGHSQQAPSRFIEKAIAKAVANYSR